MVDLTILQRFLNSTSLALAKSNSTIAGSGFPLERIRSYISLSALKFLPLKMTVAPAELLGLPLGTLAKGKPADLVLFDLDRPWRLDVKGGVGKSKNAPYDGRPVQGQVRMTVVDGRIVYQVAEA